MTRGFASIFSKFDLCVLYISSLLVPRRQRSEWEMEWRSELWHVRKICTPDHSLSWRGEREVTAFCLGAFQDAFCLSRESGQKRVPLATTKGSALQCLRFLITLIAVSYGVGLLLPGGPHGASAIALSDCAKPGPDPECTMHAGFSAHDLCRTVRSLEASKAASLRRVRVLQGRTRAFVECIASPNHGGRRSRKPESLSTARSVITSSVIRW